MTEEIELPPLPEEQPKAEEQIPHVKKYGIVEPKQWKTGAWFAQIIDPEEKRVVYECVDISKHFTLLRCIEWVESKNKNANTTTPS